MKMTEKEAKMAKASLNKANKLDAMDPKAKGMKCGGKVSKMKCGGKVKAMKKGGKC